MARAPSYEYERRERQKAKDAKRAEKNKAKSEKKDNGPDEVSKGIGANDTDKVSG